MKKAASGALLSIALLLLAASAQATFDERLWEKYAAIEPGPGTPKFGLAAFYLEPRQLGSLPGKTPFAALRVVTEGRQEVPWQIISKRPLRQTEAVPATLKNLSRTEKGETWLELRLDKQDARVTSLEVITAERDFSRQVQVLGSPDGKTWNSLRTDGVIFDFNRGEELRHTRVSFPPASFLHLALRIVNGDAQPLKVLGVRALQESDSPGQTYALAGSIGKQENVPGRKESSLVVRMNSAFPLDRLVIETPDRNFQRMVEVQVRRGTGDWVPWAQGTVFNFDTPTVHESQLVIEIPEISAEEFRLIFRNLDSPALAVRNVYGQGYQKLLVFKLPEDQRTYLFWGNPKAEPPQYDLSGLLAKQQAALIPTAVLGQTRINSKFAGNSARLPFTERYQYLLYGMVAIVIAGLALLQYRVLRQMGREEGKK